MEPLPDLALVFFAPFFFVPFFALAPLPRARLTFVAEA